MCPSDTDDFAKDFDLEGFEPEEFEGDEDIADQEESDDEDIADQGDGGEAIADQSDQGAANNSVAVGDWVQAELQGVLTPVTRVTQIYEERGRLSAMIEDAEGNSTGIPVDALIRVPEPERKPNGKANGQHASHQTDSGTTQQSEPKCCLNIRDVGDLVELPPPREKLLGNSFCKEFLSGLISPGGIGKTTLRILQALALTCGGVDEKGIGISGERVYQRSRVLILCMEDSRKELDRRLWAMMRHHSIEPKDVKGWLFVDAPRGLKLALTGKKQQWIRGELEGLVREAVQQYGFDLVIFDPLVDAHELDENFAGDMNYVCGLLTKMAIELAIAIDSPHHTRKGATAPGDPDSGRGSTAIPAKSRLVYTLTVMSLEEAKAFNVDPEDRFSYLRLDSAKVNIAPHARRARWFKLVGVSLGNATEKYPDGDFVQAMEVWTPPETWQGMDADVIEAILSDIEQGMPNRQRYSNYNAAKERSAWLVVQNHCPEKGEAECKEVIRAWVNNGTLYVDEYHDPVRRAMTKGLYVKKEKV